MRATIVSFLAGLLGGGLGAIAATRWIPGPRAAVEPTSMAESGVLEAVRAQLQEWRAASERPRELAAPPTRPSPASAASPTGPGASDASSPAGSAGAPSAALADAIEKAVAAGIEKARKADPNAFGPPKPEAKKKATLAEVSRDLGLSSAQEDDIRRAYSESTERLLKLVAEPESTADAVRRELEEAKGDAGKRTAVTLKYMPKVLGKLGDFVVIQSERQARIHKALGKENVPKFERYKVAEDDPFGLDGGGDGDGISVGVSAGG